MERITLVTNITPEELSDKILKGFINEFQELKEHYQPKEPDVWLTRKETASLLKISLVCLHDWCNRGILKPYKLGNRTYFNRNEIDEVIRNSNRK